MVRERNILKGIMYLTSKPDLTIISIFFLTVSILCFFYYSLMSNFKKNPFFFRLKGSWSCWHAAPEAFSRAISGDRGLQLRAVCRHTDHHASHWLQQATWGRWAASEKHSHAFPPPARDCVSRSWSTQWAVSFSVKYTKLTQKETHLTYRWKTCLLLLKALMGFSTFSQPSFYFFLRSQALSERFCGELSDDKMTLYSFFPDEYFTCSSVCLSCK